MQKIISQVNIKFKIFLLFLYFIILDLLIFCFDKVRKTFIEYSMILNLETKAKNLLIAKYFFYI